MTLLLNTKMKPEIKSAWVKALLSGDYTQCRSRLKSDETNVTRHDALGVLCELHKQADLGGHWNGGRYVGGGTEFNDWSSFYPPPSVLTWSGLLGGEAYAVAKLGDDIAGFEAVAEWIEENL